MWRQCHILQRTVAQRVSARPWVGSSAVRQLEASTEELVQQRSISTFGGLHTAVYRGLATHPGTDHARCDELRAIEHLIGEMQPGPMVPPPKAVVVVISGPSGVGKDSVVARLKEQRKDLYFVVTATSRAARPLEVEGRDYFFVNREKFQDWIKRDMLLEYALVYGDYKGIPRQQVNDVLRSGTDVVLRIDVQGAATVKRLLPDAITIFVAAETETVLVERLVARKTESLEKLAVRVATARAEVARIPEFDYVVVNGSGALEACVAQVSSIIDAEKARVKNRAQTKPHGQSEEIGSQVW